MLVMGRFYSFSKKNLSTYLLALDDTTPPHGEELFLPEIGLYVMANFYAGTGNREKKKQISVGQAGRFLTGFRFKGLENSSKCPK